MSLNCSEGGLRWILGEEGGEVLELPGRAVLTIQNFYVFSFSFLTLNDLVGCAADPNRSC